MLAVNIGRIAQHVRSIDGQPAGLFETGMRLAILALRKERPAEQQVAEMIFRECGFDRAEMAKCPCGLIAGQKKPARQEAGRYESQNYGN